MAIAICGCNTLSVAPTVAYTYPGYFKAEFDESQHQQDDTNKAMQGLLGNNGACAPFFDHRNSSAPQDVPSVDDCKSGLANVEKLNTSPRPHWLIFYEVWAGVAFVEAYCGRLDVATILRNAISVDADAQRQIGHFGPIGQDIPKLRIDGLGKRTRVDLQDNRISVDCVALSETHSELAEAVSALAAQHAASAERWRSEQ